LVPTHLPLDFNVNSKNFLFSFLLSFHPFCSLIVKHNEDPSQTYCLIFRPLILGAPKCK
jgi:hypothetical protein